MIKKKLEILKSVLGSYDKRGEEYLFRCPSCKHKKRKLSVNIEKNAWKCWVCEFSGYKIYRILRKYGTFNSRKAWEGLEGERIPSNFEERLEELFSLDVSQEKEEVLDLPESFQTLTKDQGTLAYRKAKSYLHKRGLTDLDILYWKIGFCTKGDYANRIVIPSFNKNGDLNYFVGRTFDNDFFKYKLPASKKSNIIFNELFVDWTKDLILVEGVFDAIKSGNAIPLLGSSLEKNTKLFKNIVLHDTPIYLALDSDVENKSWSLIEKLLKYNIEIFKIDTSDIEDVGAISPEDFKTLKDKAKRIDDSVFLKNKLRMVL